MEATEQCQQELNGALTRIAAKGRAGSSAVHFSIRIPHSCAMAVGMWESGLQAFGMMRRIGADRAWALHGEIYRVRPDVGAIVTARLPWAARLGMLSGEMPAVFEDQARQLGARVQRIALEGGALSATSADILRRGENAFLLGQEAVCLGFNKDRAVFNAELLEKCAEAYVLAVLSGHPVLRIPFYVRYIAGRLLHADEMRAAEALQD